MATLTERNTFPESQKQNQARTASCQLTTKDVLEHFQEYQRERPGVVALWCFGIGFVLGWKFKLW
jgi:hypothetical protein